MYDYANDRYESYVIATSSDDKGLFHQMLDKNALQRELRVFMDEYLVT